MTYIVYCLCIDILRQKDLEQAMILEEKMTLQLKLLAAAGLTNVPEPPDYCHLVQEQTDTGAMWKKVISAVQVGKIVCFKYMDR